MEVDPASLAGASLYVSYNFCLSHTRMHAHACTHTHTHTHACIIGHFTLKCLSRVGEFQNIQSLFLPKGVCSFYHVELDPASLVGASLYVPFLWCLLLLVHTMPIASPASVYSCTVYRSCMYVYSVLYVLDCVYIGGHTMLATQKKCQMVANM